MTQSKIAPRRWPFDLGTKMVFIQAAPPPGWVQETINDRFLRVMTSNAGNHAVASELTVSYTNVPHTHSIPDHNHSVGDHYHSGTHNHDQPYATQGLVDARISAIESWETAFYETHIGNGGGWDAELHLRTVGGNQNEGQHDHRVYSPRSAQETKDWVGNVNTSTDSVPQSGGDGSGTTDSLKPGYTPDPPYAAESLYHRHTISSSFRPKYKDVVIARLVVV